jgi:tetratricopeptide (TPR) repeat protein
LKNLAGADALAPLPGAEGPAVDFDLYVPLLSLPRIFKTTLETIPRAVPYLHADRKRAQAWRARIDADELRVGLVWAGTSTEPSRACPLAWFTPITRLPGVKFYGLQKGPEADELERRGLPAGMQLRNLGREFNDFMDTAGAVENLDLVVSIDTSVAHLAGAMGMPVWLLLGDLPDWRWLLNREDSPWYPTMRLFRQEKKGDWAAPLTRVARRLEELGAILERARRVDGVAGLLAAAAHCHARNALGEALVFYRRVLAVRPDDPEALQGMGLVAYQTGNYGRAAEFLQQAIAGSPQEDRYHYHLGLAQIALQAPQKAAEAFSRACRLNPANASARFNLNKLLRPEE